MSRIGDQKRFWSGLIFLGIGLLALWRLPRDIGTATAMGPGYFPMLLSLCLILFGASAMVLGLTSPRKVTAEPLPVLTLVLVLGAVALFALLITRVGLAVSLFCLIALSCLGRIRQHPLELLLIYLALLALTWFVFIYIVQLPLTLW